MEKKLLRDYSDLEKGAYLGAISSIATADHSATEEEIEYMPAGQRNGFVIESVQYGSAGGIEFDHFHVKWWERILQDR